MEKLLMLGNNSGTMELLETAKNRGIYTIVTDYTPYEENEAKQYADEHWMISTDDLDSLETKCRAEGINGIICGVSEFNIARVLELTERLGLSTYTTSDVWAKASNKYEFKSRCKKYGVRVAKDYAISLTPSEEELAAVQYPVVVKPVDQCANRGMSFCHNREELEKGIAYAKEYTKSDKLIVEQMLSGVEYVCYYALADGEATLLMILPGWTQPGFPRNCYGFGYNVSTREYREKIDPQIRRVLADTGCRDGVCFVQFFKEDDGEYYALEMGYRLSGDMMARPMRQQPGFDAYSWLIDLALGKKHTPDQLPVVTEDFQGKTGSYILWSNVAGVTGKIEGVEELMQIPNMNLQMVAQLGKPFKQYQYMAIITYPADSYDEMMDILYAINEKLKVYDQNGNNVLIYYTDYQTVEEYERNK